jgi:hypothetical protein
MQHITAESTATSSELLVLSPQEASVGFRAVRYHLQSEVQ